MRLSWSERDLDIVETLARRVHLLSVEQVAQIWWPETNGRRVVRRRLRKLAMAGLIERRVVNVRVLAQLSSPLACWNPGDHKPDHTDIAQKARSRWPRVARPHELVATTRLAANLFGSAASRFPPVHHRDHDLLLGQVFVLYRATRPDEASCWRGRSTLLDTDVDCRTDALIVDHQQQTTRAVESAGRGNCRQLAVFHARCVKADLPYEIW